MKFTVNMSIETEYRPPAHKKPLADWVARWRQREAVGRTEAEAIGQLVIDETHERNAAAAEKEEEFDEDDEEEDG